MTRQQQTIEELFTAVKIGLRGNRSTTLYAPDLLVGYYNRALDEIWPVLVQLGAGIVEVVGEILTDGLARDHVLPDDFQAFALGGVLPRSPLTATADYSHGRALDQCGLFDSSMTGAPTTTRTPSKFAVFISDGVQYLRFDSIPPAGEYYDYLYYQVPPRAAVATIGTTYTPWLGICDPLIQRTLEEFCREGLEFVTSKREAWRARAEADLALLLGLRKLADRKVTPSIWAGDGVRR